MPGAVAPPAAGESKGERDPHRAGDGEERRLDEEPEDKRAERRAGQEAAAEVRPGVGVLHAAVVSGQGRWLRFTTLPAGRARVIATVSFLPSFEAWIVAPIAEPSFRSTDQPAAGSRSA